MTKLSYQCIPIDEDGYEITFIDRVEAVKVYFDPRDRSQVKEIIVLHGGRVHRIETRRILPNTGNRYVSRLSYNDKEKIILVEME